MLHLPRLVADLEESEKEEDSQRSQRTVATIAFTHASLLISPFPIHHFPGRHSEWWGGVEREGWEHGWEQQGGLRQQPTI